MEDLKKTVLYYEHNRNNGKMVEYAGWALPVQFEGITIEHEAVRNFAGLFDVSHMGEIEVRGNEAMDYVQNLITNDVSKLEDNQVLYSFMCYPTGGIVDDLLVYKFSSTHFILVVNAANIEKDYQWLKEHIANYDVDIYNLSEDIAQIALQGPRAEEILQQLTNIEISKIQFFHFQSNVNLGGSNCLISRTGYTGEDGFEIYLDNKEVEGLWKKLMKVGKERGLKPVGLGARDTLRFEAGLPLYGNEISRDITPLEAGFGFFVKLDKPNFIGKESLEKQQKEGLKRKIVGFEMKDKGIPRQDYEIMEGDKVIGFVTTGHASPTLKKNIGLAMLDIAYASVGTSIDVKIRKKILKAVVISRQFYRKNYKKI